MSKKKRKRSTRRDRRKAKQTGYARQPRKAGKVGHGTAQTFAHVGTHPDRPKDTP